MRPKLIHVVGPLNRGGLQLGVAKLVELGFYRNFDFHMLSLANGDGKARPDFERALGGKEIPVLFDHLDLSARATSVIYRIYRELEKKFAETRPHMVVLSGRYVALAGRMAAMHFPSTRVVTFEHDTLHDGIKGFLGDFVTSFRNDAVLGDTEATIKHAGKRSFVSRPAFEVPLTILEAASPRAPYRPSEFRAVSFGRLAEQKNYPATIEAVARLRADGYPLTLDIYGEGSQHRELTKLIARFGADDAIRLKGHVSDPVILKTALHKADIYLQPSLHEGFCLATAEALAAGVPAVTTPVGGMTDYGRDGANLMHAKGPKASDIMVPLRRLMNDYETLAPVLSQGAVETAQQRFSESAVRHAWDAVGQQLCNLVLTPRRVAGPLRRLASRYSFEK